MITLLCGFPKDFVVKSAIRRCYTTSSLSVTCSCVVVWRFLAGPEERDGGPENETYLRQAPTHRMVLAFDQNDRRQVNNLSMHTTDEETAGVGAWALLEPIDGVVTMGWTRNLVEYQPETPTTSTSYEG